MRSPVLSGPNNRDPSDDPKPDCPVSMTVPVEFAGSSMSQLSIQGGIVKGMDVKAGAVVIQGLIPEHQFAELARAVKEFTRDTGTVERQQSVNE